jgi:hypothetical protein
MGKETQNNKTGRNLIIGGLALAAITLGGFYLSQNPQIISDWQNKRNSERRDQLAEKALVAPDTCANVSTAMFANACGKLELDYDQQDWKEGLSPDEQSCLLQSFRDVALYKLEYDGAPKSQLANLENDSDIIVHACGVSEDLNFYRPDHASADAQEMLNAWYQWKYSEGNYFE